MTDYLLCSNCFRDQGLKLDAALIGVADDTLCANCNSTIGRKLTRDSIITLSRRFFVWGTLERSEYGGAPLIQFNNLQATSIRCSPWTEPDLRLIEKAARIGFFDYGPRLWMVGEVEPLRQLQDPETRGSVLGRILAKYPTAILTPERLFYRLRKAPEKPEGLDEYDSPPVAFAGSGRLDSANWPVMYGSQDLPICIHECRVTAEDDLFVATLAPTRDLRLLDLTELLAEEHVTEFESLDIAVHMLFLAGKHSYSITREIALAAHISGFDGLIYPSYFSLLRTGGMPFETALGISHRKLPHLADREKSKMIPNLALFGRPIEQRSVEVRCINRLILNRVAYGVHFGPVGFADQ
jgi:hypothetical protein